MCVSIWHCTSSIISQMLTQQMHTLLFAQLCEECRKRGHGWWVAGHMPNTIMHASQNIKISTVKCNTAVIQVYHSYTWQTYRYVDTLVCQVSSVSQHITICLLLAKTCVCIDPLPDLDARVSKVLIFYFTAGVTFSPKPSNQNKTWDIVSHNKTKQHTHTHTYIHTHSVRTFVYKLVCVYMWVS